VADERTHRVRVVVIFFLAGLCHIICIVADV
jgi:hypothetical protein